MRILLSKICISTCQCFSFFAIWYWSSHDKLCHWCNRFRWSKIDKNFVQFFCLLSYLKLKETSLPLLFIIAKSFAERTLTSSAFRKGLKFAYLEHRIQLNVQFFSRIRLSRFANWHYCFNSNRIYKPSDPQITDMLSSKVLSCWSNRDG